MRKYKVDRRTPVTVSLPSALVDRMTILAVERHEPRSLLASRAVERYWLADDAVDVADITAVTERPTA